MRQLYTDHDVLVADSFQFGEGRLDRLDRSRFQVSRVDIRDTGAVQSVVREFDPAVIVHLAAIHFIPLCEAEPRQAIETNVVGTVNLLQACPPGARFVFASSAAVYRPDTKLHNEATSEVGPNDVYGLTKLHGEQFVRYFSKLKDFSAAIVRLFNVVGPGETNPHLLPEIVAQLKRGQSTIQLGNIWPKRDYIHVADAARGFAAVATRGEISSGEVATVNLGTSLQFSVEEILAKLRQITQLEFKVETDPSRVRAVDRPYLGADIGLIGTLFGWKPRYGIDQAIVDLWQDPEGLGSADHARPIAHEAARASAGNPH